MATEQLFVSIIIILVAARVLGEFFQRIGRPPLVGELFAGLIIGPSILGLVLPSDDLHVLSSLAIFFLMFWAHNRSVLVHGLTVVNNCCSRERHSANAIWNSK